MPLKPAPSNVRRLHKSPQAVREFLDRLDAGGDKEGVINARRSDRYPYRVRALVVELEQVGAGWVRYEVPSRNLSREGASFLLGHFAYPGSPCRVHLVSLQNQRRVVPARTVRCRYIPGSGTLHEVGVVFEKPIEIAMYNRQAARSHFLLVSKDPSVQQIIGQWLGELEADLAHASSGSRAVELAARAEYDAALVDLGLPDPAGVEAVRALRQGGFARPIVVVTSEETDQHRGACLAAGCNSFLTKPISRDRLLDVIRSFKEKPLTSTMAQDQGFIGLINVFVAELPEKVGRLESAFSQGNHEALAAVVRMLKGEGGAYGFQPITDAATKVEHALGDKLEAPEIRAPLNELINVCLAARAVGSPECSGAAAVAHA